jgi:hypothetical protein
MEAPTIGIGRLLRDGGRFFVPPHQRDYSWSEDEIEQFFVDIGDAVRAGQPDYFIGLMVFMPIREREYTILDGQQRLATTTLILGAIRNWLRRSGLGQDADQIQTSFVATRELGGRDYRSRLVLNQRNNPLFERFVVAEISDDEVLAALEQLKRFDPNRRLLEAIVQCKRKIDEVMAVTGADPGTVAQQLYRFVRFLEDSVKVVQLVVDTEANAYTVFETLNDRGLDLSVLDLVKNHVFGKAGPDTRLRDIQGLWTQMMGNLAGTPADEFLKTWWTARHGRVQTPQLFPRFKQQVQSRDEAAAVSEDMLRASEIYGVLEIADDPLWSDLSLKARERIRSLRLLGAQQLRPILLAAREQLPGQEIERLLHLLEVLIVRYQLVGGGRTGRLEIACARVAHRIHKREIATASAARDALREVLPSDEEFRASFLTKQERNNQKAKYVLSCLEFQARRAEGHAAIGDELGPTPSLTVEHVFPKSVSQAWRAIVEADPTVPEECTFKLGNLCLLTGVNKALGGAAFDEKKLPLGQSALLLTKEVGQEAVWNRRAIEQRQARLAALAVAYWRLQ